MLYGLRFIRRKRHEMNGDLKAEYGDGRVDDGRRRGVGGYNAVSVHGDIAMHAHGRDGHNEDERKIGGGHLFDNGQIVRTLRRRGLWMAVGFDCLRGGVARDDTLRADYDERNGDQNQQLQNPAHLTLR